MAEFDPHGFGLGPDDHFGKPLQSAQMSASWAFRRLCNRTISWVVRCKQHKHPLRQHVSNDQTADIRLSFRSIECYEDTFAGLAFIEQRIGLGGLGDVPLVGEDLVQIDIAVSDEASAIRLNRL